MTIKIGILGQDGFLGTHFYNYLRIKENVVRIPSSKEVFNSQERLTQFAEKCDVIVHFAGKSRSDNMQELYGNNMSLVHRFISAMKNKQLKPLVLFGSTTHENRESLYHQSKRDGHKAFLEWAYMKKAKAITLMMPNVFGPYCKPNFNSFVATFCNKIANGEKVEIINDAPIELIYIHDLCKGIYSIITDEFSGEKYFFKNSTEKKATEVHSLIECFKQSLDQDKIPVFKNRFEINLFNTFLSYYGEIE
jgi:UDP-2-acetamido-2,6-beta-L-arabino-hexul-4-ose reductase